MAQWLKRRTCTQQTWVQLPLVGTCMSRWWRQEGHLAKNCSSAPAKVRTVLLGMSEPLNKGVSDVKFGNISFVLQWQNMKICTVLL